MGHGLESIIPILEILEIEVSNILYNPGNIGKRMFLISPILEILENTFFLISHILEILDRTIHTQSYPGNIGSYDPYSVLSWKYWIVRSILSPILEIVDRTIQYLLIILKTFFKAVSAEHQEASLPCRPTHRAYKDGSLHASPERIAWLWLR